MLLNWQKELVTVMSMTEAFYRYQDLENNCYKLL